MGQNMNYLENDFHGNYCYRPKHEIYGFYDNDCYEMDL